MNKAGLYLVEGRVNKGAHKSALFDVDSRFRYSRAKPGDAKQMYFMSDAESGKPVAGANLEFLVSAMSKTKDGQYQMKVDSFAAKTDALGIANVKLKNNYLMDHGGADCQRTPRLAEPGESLATSFRAPVYQSSERLWNQRPAYVPPRETVKNQILDCANLLRRCTGPKSDWDSCHHFYA